ncbi:MAG: Hsp70 family protein [Spirochaetota bacterium]
MDNSVIAVQIANGTFVPVLSTSSNKRRRLVVTTVRDNQTNVKIELYRGSGESMEDAEYVGSLVIDNIDPSDAGTPDVSVLLGVDESGNLNATARDNQSGEYQSLSVSLDRLEEEGGYDVPDFQLSDEELTMDELSLDEEESGMDDTLDDLSFDDLEPGDEEDAEEPPAGEPAAEGGEDESPDDEFSLDELTLEPEPEPEPEPETEAHEQTEHEAPTEPETPPTVSEEQVGDESFDLGEDLDEVSLEEPADGIGDEEELSLDGLTLDDDFDFEETIDDTLDETLEDEDETIAADLETEEPAAELAEEPAEEPAAEEEPFDFHEDETISDELTLDELSLEEPDEEEPDVGADESDVLAEFSDEEFSFDESLFEEEPAEVPDLEGGAEDETVEGETVDGATSVDELSLDEGMVEADLGDEDFTFDEGGEDEPLFPDVATEPEEEEAPAEELEDTLSAEEFDRLDAEPPQPAAVELEEEAIQPRRSNAVIFVGYLILSLAALGVLTYLVFRLLEGPPAPPLRAGLLPRLFALLPFAGVPQRLRRRSRGRGARGASRG